MEGNDSVSCVCKPQMEAENRSSDAAVRDSELPSIGGRESVREVYDSQLVGAPAAAAADSAVGGEGGPRVEAENQSGEATVQPSELPSIGKRESIRGMDDSKLVGAPAIFAADSVVGRGGGPRTAHAGTTKTEAMIKESGSGKRKRGRPSRVQEKPSQSKMMEEEEDVCFICFDGGSLVLCDRRSCPKAYHPSCIKRDEAFFKTKGKWNCGWHICSKCQKAAHYMCYTCSFSLCKGCTKDADYVCVRGTKGFCTTCLKTIMLIEDNVEGDNKTTKVDFDDITSWEYLFKIYWVCLKEKLNLTLKELTHAKNPWKEPRTTVVKGQPVNLHYGVDDSKVSDEPASEKGTISTGSALESESSLKPPEVAADQPGDQHANPNADSIQLTHSSPSDPTSNGSSSQQATFTEPIEFSTLAEESVSDLLAEVDAMESLCDLASPTSVMKCGQEQNQDSKNDCFMSDSGKSDVLSWIFGDLDG